MDNNEGTELTKTFRPSFGQEWFWFLSQLDSSHPTLVMTSRIDFRGPLNRQTLQQALNEVVQRHDALREVFTVVEGIPYASVAPPSLVQIEYRDLHSLSSDDQAKEVQRVEAAQTNHQFDLERGPLFHSILLRLSEDACILYLSIHHAVCDDFGRRIFLKEVLVLYEALSLGKPSPLPPIKTQHPEFAAWQRQHVQGRVLDDGVAYWKSRLGGAPPLLALPTDRERQEKSSGRSEFSFFEIPASILAGANEMARRLEITQYTVLLAALKVLLHRFSGVNDIIVGAPISGRDRPQWEVLIGHFANTLVLRTAISPEMTFKEAAEQTKDTVLGAMGHQDVPFEKLLERLRTGHKRANHSPVYQVVFNFTRYPMPTSVAGVRASTALLLRNTTVYDLYWLLEQQNDRIVGKTIYNSDLFNPETINLLNKGYLDILQQVSGAPAISIAELELPKSLQRGKPKKDGATLAVAGTFTVDPIVESTNFWSEYLDVPLKTEVAPYNQVFQQLLDPKSLLNVNHTGLNVLLIRIEDLYGSANAIDLRNKASQTSIREFVLTLKTCLPRLKVPTAVCICPASPKAIQQYDQAIHEAENFLAFELRHEPGVYLFSAEELLEGIDVYADEQADKLGHIPYTDLFFTALGTKLVRLHHSLTSAPYKVIVLDCDHTLWDGICGEDGASGVRVEGTRKTLQEWMVRQRAQGMLLCIASKNNEQDVWDVFQANLDMPLRREHLAAARINWGPKSESIRQLACELNLGLDSFIFIDDSAMECAEVSQSCPEVLCLQLPAETNQIPTFLKSVWAFDHWKVTDVDQKRAELYRQEGERERLRTHSKHLSDFMSSLELRVEISEVNNNTLSRAAELTQRTNQFNFSTIRRTERELGQLLGSTELQGFSVHVKDRFGDYGFVGLILTREESNVLIVDSMMLSCRALGRGVEHKMMAWIGEHAHQRNLTDVEFRFASTQKNMPAKEFLESVVVPLASVRSDTSFRLHASGLSAISRIETTESSATKRTPPLPSGAPTATAA